MINPLIEDLISPTEATRLFPTGSNAKYPHVGKVYRLMQKDLLESLKTPRLCTSRQAVARCLLLMSGQKNLTLPDCRYRGAGYPAGDIIVILLLTTGEDAKMGDQPNTRPVDRHGQRA